ncbi:MAG TPA: MFS transporter, partial [Polyangiales bacterium]|nr:MFS transporter [Polyangiales bacterium]
MPDSSTIPETSADIAPFLALRYRDFRLFQAGQLLSMVGLQMQSVAVGWQVYAITGQALDLGYVGLSLFAPSLVLAAVTGQAADRIERRKLLTACHVLLLIASLLLFAVAELSRSTFAIYTILVLIGTARAFGSPTSQALMPNLVPLSAFPNAVAWSSTTWQVATVAGPALGGLLYAAAGAGGVYGCTALLELVT